MTSDRFVESYLRYLETDSSISFQAYVLRALAAQNLRQAGLFIDYNEFGLIILHRHPSFPAAECLATELLDHQVTLMVGKWVERGEVGIGPFQPISNGSRVRLIDYSKVPELNNNLVGGNFGFLEIK